VSLDMTVSTMRRRMVPSGPIRVTTTLICSVCPLGPVADGKRKANNEPERLAAELTALTATPR
jgi:hypothetical protein